MTYFRLICALVVAISIFTLYTMVINEHYIEGFMLFTIEVTLALLWRSRE